MLQDYIAEMVQFVPDVRAGQAYPYFDLYWSEPGCALAVLADAR